MTESKKTAHYKARRKERIEEILLRNELSIEELRSSVRSQIEEENTVRVLGSWQSWRREILEGERYIPYLRLFDRETIGAVLEHIEGQYSEADYPSATEAALRTLLDLIEARTEYQRGHRENESIGLRIRRLRNLRALRSYLRTADPETLLVIPLDVKERIG